MDTKGRIKVFINYLNINVSSFEKILKVSNGYVNSISKGIGGDKLELMLEEFPDLNVEWLLTGIGNMLKETNTVLYKEHSQSSKEKVKEPFTVYGFDFKELYLDAKYTIEIQKKYIVTLEKASMV